MEITQIVGVGIISAILAMTIKKQSPEFALMISIMTSIIIFIMILPKLSAVISVLNNLAETINTSQNYIAIIFKVVSIAYIAEFGSQICIDSGETSVASKIDLAGKVLIMAVSAPVILSLLDIVINILP